MNCGHCHSQNVTVDHVRSCATFTGQTKVATLPKPPAPANVATDKQIAFITKLLAEKQHDLVDPDLSIHSRKTASALIEVLMGLPRKPKSEATPKGELQDGIYRKDGILYRVYHTVHGANRQVASIINLDAPKESKKTDKFTYVGMKPLHTLVAADMLTFEEACEIASAYEWCCACGTILHNDKSVELGIGPVCRRKFR